MIRLQSYPTYKNSGVPWLGEIPKHWRLERAKWLFRYQKEINHRREHTNILSLTLRGVVNNDPDDPEGLVPKDYATYQFFRRGDLVFKLIDLENLRTSRVGLVHEDGIMSPAYVRLAPRTPTNIRFFYHEFFDLYQRGIYNQLGVGVRSTLGPSDLLNLLIVTPSNDEQSAIVRFLDHADRRIRRYIHAKQKLIKLLEEQKQAIIHRAVTRGLDPNVRLKPSGIDWLGDVPEHWEVRPAKYSFREIDERSVTGGEELLSVSHITGVSPRSQKNITMFMASSYAGHKLCRTGDLVINTMWAWMGALGVSKQMGMVSPSYAVYRPTRPNAVFPKFIDHLLRTRPYVDEYVCRSTGIRSSRLRLYPDKFLQIPLVLPPRKEQERLVATIAEETLQTNHAIERAHREIDLLREYRTRLIADVVTGKLDVRGVELPALDEADELDDLDSVDDTESEEMSDVEEAVDGNQE